MLVDTEQEKKICENKGQDSVYKRLGNFLLISLYFSKRKPTTTNEIN